MFESSPVKYKHDSHKETRTVLTNILFSPFVIIYQSMEEKNNTDKKQFFVGIFLFDCEAHIKRKGTDCSPQTLIL